MSIQTISIQKETQKTLDFRQKYKTEVISLYICRDVDSGMKKDFVHSTSLEFFLLLQCAFAHNEDEMREKNTFNFKYKTKLCHNFFEYGFCKYGDRCQYIHNKNLRTPKDGDKTRSNSEESYSSKSSSQQLSNQEKSQQKPYEFKHQARYEMLKEKNYELFDIMMARSSWMEEIFEEKLIDSETSYNAEFYQSLGSREEKKFRMYSM